MPAVPPYSSATIARCARSRRISDRADSTVLLIGRNLIGRTTSSTSAALSGAPGPSRSLMCTKPMTLSYEPW
jgi:hypothetical protein